MVRFGGQNPALHGRDRGELTEFPNKSREHKCIGKASSCSLLGGKGLVFGVALGMCIPLQGIPLGTLRLIQSLDPWMKRSKLGADLARDWEEYWAWVKESVALKMSIKLITRATTRTPQCLAKKTPKQPLGDHSTDHLPLGCPDMSSTLRDWSLKDI